ncbi:hypothetical protein V5O84_12615 [Escherichia coli]|uniref:hypothetical protein n=1 Tax=Escherichia coli TaxID=562 RepID=UPI00203ED3B4|nr:hypothetical protein [Escherichia coli]EJB9914835.1 hypothetical protein [Escherichia coli]ELC3548239.1 hypothetical protein [Escherichia coli]MCH7451227.1 hypothetical protein [Escherichia coli]MDR5924931.1 hypothetical protein [Escherichia coli]MDR5987845.1 hypothetical protein [Escherichia coli]
MDGNIKGLVSAGHEMASELKAECGAVDMRSVAKLISDLATQLEVQLARANALAAENARLKAAHPQPFGHEMMKALDAYEKYQDEVPETGMLNAFFILRDSIRVDTQATDAFLAEVRAQGVEMYADNLDNGADDAERGGFDDAVKFLRSEASGVRLFAAQLRKGGNQ